MWTIIGGVAILLLILLLLAILLVQAAKNNQQATYVPEGTIKFIMMGSGLNQVFLNLDGFVLTREDEIKPGKPETAQPGEAPATPDEIQRFRDRESWIGRRLRKNFGIYWVSLWYPLTRVVHHFEISKARLRPANAVSANASLRERIELDPEPVTTTELRAFFQRPILVEDVESKDLLTSNLLVMVHCRVVKPHTVVFKVGRDFFATLEASVGGSVGDLVKSMGFVDFVRMDKGKGADFSKKIIEILNPRLIMDTGVKVVDIWVEKVELPPGAENVQKATQALEIATLEGNADVEKARLELEAALLRAQANAAEVTELIKAYSSGDERGALLTSSQIVAGKLPNLTVLGTGVNGLSIIVPTAPKT